MSNAFHLKFRNSDQFFLADILPDSRQEKFRLAGRYFFAKKGNHNSKRNTPLPGASWPTCSWNPPGPPSRGSGSPFPAWFPGRVKKNIPDQDSLPAGKRNGRPEKLPLADENGEQLPSTILLNNGCVLPNGRRRGDSGCRSRQKRRRPAAFTDRKAPFFCNYAGYTVFFQWSLVFTHSRSRWKAA